VSVLRFRLLEEILDDPSVLFARRALAVLSGLGLVVLAACLAVSLATWNVSDPSLTHATSAPVTNWMGHFGAAWADPVMQMFGLAAPLLIAPLALWGWRLLSGRPLGLSAGRCAAGLGALVLAPAFLDVFPTTAAWPLPMGLGGAVGEMWGHALVNWLGITSGTVHGAAGGLFGVAALACLLKAVSPPRRPQPMAGAGFQIRRQPAPLDDEYGLEDTDTYEAEPSRLAALGGALAHLALSLRAQWKKRRPAGRRERAAPALRDALAGTGHALPEDPSVYRARRRVPAFEDEPPVPAGIIDDEPDLFERPAPPRRQREEVRRERADAPVRRAAVREAAEAPVRRDARREEREARPVNFQLPLRGPAARLRREAVGGAPASATTARTASADERTPREDHRARREADAVADAAVDVDVDAWDEEAFDASADEGDHWHDEARGHHLDDHDDHDDHDDCDDHDDHDHHGHHDDQEYEDEDDAGVAEARASGGRREDEGPRVGDRYDDDDGDGDGDEGEDWDDPYAAEAARHASRAAAPRAAQQPVPALQPRVTPPAGAMKPGRRVVREAQPSFLSAADYEFPPLALLAAPRAGHVDAELTMDALEANARVLEGVLEDFGVKGQIIHVRPGPVVTLYELEPAPGIKSSRVIGLADDIARSMSAISARVAVIPGKNAIGIELPNRTRVTVFLRELLASEDFERTKSRLPLCLGKTIGGEAVIADLARMPHLLVAGTTGSGKSVSINTMILSLLYWHKPEVCRIIPIDPKMLELSVYDGIPHLLTPVVTDPKKAVAALRWAVREMEERYQKMAKLGVRNIDGYNARLREAEKEGKALTRLVQTGFDRHTGEAIFEEEVLDLEPIPFIVVVVDEMADLMMVAGKDIEGAIQRLAQMARAAGIHLIMATQRPSVDVITGTIKANFPTRISFQVTSKIDSRTILGEMGAEQLLGMGDMLFMAGGGRIQRVHGPFVSDEEVEDVVAHLKRQGAPDYLTAVLEDEDEEGGDDEAGGGGLDAMSESDDLYDRAVALVLRDRKASTSYVQRRLSIGYNRAATLIERMEREGVVSPANHAGKREILVPAEGEAA